MLETFVELRIFYVHIYLAKTNLNIKKRVWISVWAVSVARTLIVNLP